MRLLAGITRPSTLKEEPQNLILFRCSRRETAPMRDRYRHQTECRARKLTKYL